MIYFIPSVIVFLLQVYLLISWWQARKRMDGKEKKFILFGFFLGQIYLIGEVLWVQYTGKPLPNSSEQKFLIGRLLLGGSLGGLFVIMGLFYLSFASYGQSEKLDRKDAEE